MTRRLLGLLVVALLIAPSAGAQSADSLQTRRNACTDAAYRAFDFWVGTWVVRDSTGKQVGTSRISTVAGGCGIREEWAGTSGSRGTSLNYFDPNTGSWHQDWVGSSGLVLHISGGREGDSMVLTGTRSTDEEMVRDRIEWRPLEGNRVRQEWSSSSDGGNTWNRVFLGFYEPAPGETTP